MTVLTRMRLLLKISSVSTLTKQVVLRHIALKKNYIETLALSLFKQSAEHLTVLIKMRPLTLGGLIRVNTDQTSPVKTQLERTTLEHWNKIYSSLAVFIQIRLLFLRGLICFDTDQTSQVKTHSLLDLSLFKQYAEHLSSLILLGLLTLRDLFMTNTGPNKLS